jgi:hypothetical protein
MRPKVILQLYPMLPAEGEDGRKRQRSLGRDSSLYHRVVHDWLDVIKAAENACFPLTIRFRYRGVNQDPTAREGRTKMVIENADHVALSVHGRSPPSNIFMRERTVDF